MSAGDRALCLPTAEDTPHPADYRSDAALTTDLAHSCIPIWCATVAVLYSQQGFLDWDSVRHRQRCRTPVARSSATTEPMRVSLQLDGPTYDGFDDLARASDAAIRGVVVDVGKPYEVHPEPSAPELTLVVTPVTFEVKQVLYGSSVRPGDRIEWLFPSGSTATLRMDSGFVPPEPKTKVLAVMLRDSKDWIRVALLADNGRGLSVIGGDDSSIGAVVKISIGKAAGDLAASKQRVGERVVTQPATASSRTATATDAGKSATETTAPLVDPAP